MTNKNICLYYHESINNNKKQKETIMAKTEFYCVKCGKKTNEEILEEAITKNNRPIAKGKCTTCGCKVNKFLPIKK